MSNVEDIKALWRPGCSPNDETHDIGNALADEGKSPHKLDSINSGGAAGSGMDFTTTSEAGRGHVSTSSQHDQCKYMSRLLKRKQVDNAFLGFVQMVK